METVAFYSYKGGVGRTLLVANTALFLAMSGRRVVAIDLDLEAPGLHYKLGNPDVLKRAANGTLPGAVDKLLSILEGEQTNAHLKDIAVEVSLHESAAGSLILIPAGSAPSHAYWGALERLNAAIRAGGPNGGLLEAVLELQARIDRDFSPDILLIDSRTGITELGGMATSVLADRVVCLTTTAQESIEGIRIAADALKAAPRLSSQKPIVVDFLITRVSSDSWTSTFQRLTKEFGETVTMLPHDSGIARKEFLLSDSRLRAVTDDDNEGTVLFNASMRWIAIAREEKRLSDATLRALSDDVDEGMGLFPATLNWIAMAFPSHEQDAEKARRRMESVHRVWRDLTRTSERLRDGIGSREAWPLDQIRERVRFANGKRTRQADIVVYDHPADVLNAKPLMIIEYVDGEDRDAVAKWWITATRAPVEAPVVVVISDKQERRVYSGKFSISSDARPSNRWDIPLPHDFKALSDPTDVSVDAMLDAVRRGHAEYLDRIVAEWVRCSASGLNGGAPWKPKIAKRIIDALVSVDDPELARRVLWATSPSSFSRRMWLGDGDDYVDEQVHTDLFTPLLWRLPPEASMDLMRAQGGPFGPGPGVGAVALLARGTFGLHYDPDATFRIEAQRVLERSDRNTESDDDEGIYALASAFRLTEITFEISSDMPPLMARETMSGDAKHQTKDVGSIVAECIANQTLITTGLLGDYLPAKGRVVLYKAAIAQCAERLALRERHVGSVVLIHETIHALSHLGRDLDGRMWPEFHLPSADSPLFEPSWFHETLTQYFTYKHIVKLQDPSLQHAFEVLSSKQTPEYRAWEQIRDLPIEDARNWFMSIRRGVGSTTPSQILFNTRRADG